MKNVNINTKYPTTRRTLGQALLIVSRTVLLHGASHWNDAWKWTMRIIDDKQWAVHNVQLFTAEVAQQNLTMHRCAHRHTQSMVVHKQYQWLEPHRPTSSEISVVLFPPIHCYIYIYLHALKQRLAYLTNERRLFPSDATANQTATAGS